MSTQVKYYVWIGVGQAKSNVATIISHLIGSGTATHLDLLLFRFPFRRSELEKKLPTVSNENPLKCRSLEIDCCESPMIYLRLPVWHSSNKFNRLGGGEEEKQTKSIYKSKWTSEAYDRVCYIDWPITLTRVSEGEVHRDYPEKRRWC